MPSFKVNPLISEVDSKNPRLIHPSDSIQLGLKASSVGCDKYFFFNSYPTTYASDTDFTIGDLAMPMNSRVHIFQIGMFLEVCNPAAQLAHVRFFYPSYNANVALQLGFSGNNSVISLPRPFVLESGSGKYNYRITGRQFTGGASAVFFHFLYTIEELHRP